MEKKERKPGRSYGAGRSPVLQLRETRCDGWTDRKRERFLTALAESCNVTHSARMVKMSQRSCYAQRRKNPGFRESWDEALCMGFDRLELAMLHRATHGTPKPVFHSGKEIAKIIQYPEQTAMRLLQAHRDAVERTRLRGEEGLDPDAVFEEIKRRLAEMKAREEGDARESFGDTIPNSGRRRSDEQSQ